MYAEGFLDGLYDAGKAAVKTIVKVVDDVAKFSLKQMKYLETGNLTAIHNEITSAESTIKADAESLKSFFQIMAYNQPEKCL